MEGGTGKKEANNINMMTEGGRREEEETDRQTENKRGGYKEERGNGAVRLLVRLLTLIFFLSRAYRSL